MLFWCHNEWSFYLIRFWYNFFVFIIITFQFLKQQNLPLHYSWFHNNNFPIFVISLFLKMKCQWGLSKMQTTRNWRLMSRKNIWREMFLVNCDFGPSGLRALPLGVAAERSVHCIWYYFSSFFFFFYQPHTFLTEGVVLGLWNVAKSFQSPQKRFGVKHNFVTPLGGLF